jgi:hydroxyacylglutathione hydrolase
MHSVANGTNLPDPPTLEVRMIPCLEDNYGYLVHDPESGFTACVDTPEVEPIMACLRETGWRLSHILNTHHHFDHAGGNLELKEKTGCIIVGSRKDAARIPGIDIQMGNDDVYLFGRHEMRIWETPGHTLGHLVYYFPQSKLLFAGDTLFALGCGRLFEGSPEDMWTSLQLLLELPDDTRVYCAHEYTAANARFALSVDPDNADLQLRAADIKQLRAQGKPTIPTTIGLERRTNPFLRPQSAGIRSSIGLPDAPDVEVFAAVRARKDKF